ncbi:hypothetical protein HanIR_Chr15g0740681 [Helianthus annuus]|nr:hypothetical protein HanIR_Chr15g0740681 [Helianthus annuus]
MRDLNQHLVSEPSAREEHGEGRFESRFLERGVARCCGANATGKQVVRESRWLFGTGCSVRQKQKDVSGQPLLW